MNTCPLCGSSSIRPVANRYLRPGQKDPSLIVHFQCGTCRHAWGSQHLSQAEGQAWLQAHGAELSALECAGILIQRLRTALQEASAAGKPGADVAGLAEAAQDWLAERPVKGRFLTDLEWRRLLALVESDLGWKDRTLLDFLHDEDKWVPEART